MIDSRTIANALHEEARLFVQNMKFSAPESDLGFERNWERATSEHPVPDTERLAQLIDSVFWTSVSTEEGRPCRPRLTYAPAESSGLIVHRFDESVNLTRESLRGLAPACGPNYLAWHVDGDRLLLNGIVGHQGMGPMGLTVVAAGTGVLDLLWYGFQFVTFRGGVVERWSQNRLPTSGGRGPYLAELFGGTDAVFLERSVRVIADQGHGGALWIVRDPSVLANSGVRIGVKVNDVGPALLDRKHDEQVRWLETIGHLSGVDGAVVLDGSARLLGFGAFIPTPGDAFVFRYHKDTGPTMSSASTIGGGRHRSAIQFCATCAPAAAYVVSEDGRISFVASDRKNSIPLYAEIVSLGGPSIL